MSRGPDRLRFGAALLAGGLAVAALALLSAPSAARAQAPGEPVDPPIGPGAGALRMESLVSIRVVPDPVAPGDSLTVGDPFWATVVSSGPRGYYLLPESVVEAYRERPEVAVLDTDRRDGRLRLRLALFRVGDVVLPDVGARVVEANGDTLLATVRSDTIRVASVLAPGDTLLADVKPLWEPRGLPAWVPWALAAALLALVAGLWWWRRRRGARAAPAAAAVEAGDPYGEAVERIEAAGRRTSGPAERIAAAGEIGDALRDYLARAWGVPARERTTFELVPLLPAPIRALRPAVAALLAEVDLAKFARVDPGPEGVEALARRGLRTLERLEESRGAVEAPGETGARRPAEAAS